VRISRRDSRQAALVELERLHAAILASREKRGFVPATAPSAEALAARHLTERLQREEPERLPGPRADEAPGSRRLWWLGAAAAILLAGSWAAVNWWPRPEVVTEAAPPPAATGPTTAARTPAAASAPASTPAPAAAAHALRLTLHANRPVWLRVFVDGTRAIEREVAANEHLVYEGDAAIVVRAGDAGGVHASFNGEVLGPLGKDGLPITVRFPPIAPAPPAAAPTSPPE
jgi:hypothetical protein